MTAYLTPARFRTMRHGLNLDGLDDLALSEILEDAGAVTDAYCAVPYGHSFLGGSIVGEMRPWKYPDNLLGQHTRKVFPKHSPVISVSQFLLQVGSSASASLPVDSIVINNQKGWIEVTSASIVGSSGLFGVSGWVVPFGGLEQPIAVLDYLYGWELPADDRLYPVADSTTLFQAPHGHWIEDAEAPVVTAAGLEVDPGDYTIDYEEGRVTFAADPDHPIRAQYRHKLQREIMTANSLIAADLVGASKLVAKGMTGIEQITVGEITIERPRGVRWADMAAYLSHAVPQAAMLLDGFRVFSAA